MFIFMFLHAIKKEYLKLLADFHTPLETPRRQIYSNMRINVPAIGYRKNIEFPMLVIQGVFHLLRFPGFLSADRRNALYTGIVEIVCLTKIFGIYDPV